MGGAEFALRGQDVADEQAEAPEPAEINQLGQVRQALGFADVLEGRPDGRDEQEGQGVGPAEGARHGDLADAADDGRAEHHEEEDGQDGQQQGYDHGGSPASGEHREGGREGDDPRREGGGVGEGEEFLQGRGVGQREGTGLQAAQGREMGAAAEGLADVVDEGADVGALGAFDAEAGGGRGETEQIEAVDVDAAGLAFDGLALVVELVEGDAVDLDGRYHGRRLHLVAPAAIPNPQSPIPNPH